MKKHKLKDYISIKYYISIYSLKAKERVFIVGANR